MKRTPLKRKTPIRSYKKLEARKPLRARDGLRRGGRKGNGRKRYWSIFTDDMGKCHITGDTEDVEPHHIFQGEALKPLSEKYGFMVPLRSDWHRTGNYAIHRDRGLNVSYKRRCQEHYINVLGKTRQEWIREFGKWWTVEDGKGGTDGGNSK